MAITPPTVEPEWASSNPTDPVSLQPAIIEPSASKKASGHTRNEIPVRQDHNWLFNTLWQWQVYLKAIVNAFSSILSTIVSDSGSEITFDIEDPSTVVDSLDFKYKGDFIEGFHIQDWPSSNAVAISVGKCLSDDRTSIIDGFTHGYTTPFIKRIDGVSGYEYGSGNSGLADGLYLSNDTWFHLFVFRYNDVATPKVDFCFDEDITGANLPANTGKRRIMSLHYVNQGSVPGFFRVKQLGDWFIAPIQSVDHVGPWTVINQANIGSGDPPRKWVSIATKLPPFVDTIADVCVSTNINPGVAQDVIMRSPVEVEEYSAFISSIIRSLEGSYNIKRFHKIIPGNDQRLWVGFSENATPVDTLYMNFSIFGYMDRRGKEWGSGPSGTIQNRYFEHTPPV